MSFKVNRLRLFAAVSCAWLVGACTPVPLANNHWLSYQPKTRSVMHWKLIADQMVGSIQDRLPADGSVVYVRPAFSRSPFSDAFESYLTSKLISLCAEKCEVGVGHPMPASMHVCAGRVDCAAVPAAVTVTYGLQKVVHRDHTTGRAPPGAFTLLGTGIWLGRQANSHWTAIDRYVAGIPTGALLDLLEGSVATPTHTEVIVSIALVRADGNAPFRSDASFYVDDEDMDEYPNEPLYVSNGAPANVEWAPITIRQEYPICHR